MIGVIGGSGLYDFLKGEWVWINTPFGLPSDKILVTEYAGKKIAFLPRHGRDHQYPPHKINYKANLFALKKLGVKQILAPCAAGSLKPEIEPGHFVIADQFIDRTKGREDTFFNGPRAVHVSMANPYCPALRKILVDSCQSLGIPYHPEGTIVVIEGPRFSTKAESKLYTQSADVVNMTQYPEVVLARELEMCYANISLITDYDAGLKDEQPVTAQKVAETFQKNNEKVRELILDVIQKIPDQLDCNCQNALQDAVL